MTTRLTSIGLNNEIARLAVAGRDYETARIPTVAEWIEVLYVPDCGMAGVASGGGVCWFNATSLEDAIAQATDGL